MPALREIFTTIIGKLTKEELEYLIGLSDIKREQVISALIKLSEISAGIFELCLKEFRREELTEEELRILIEIFGVYSCLDLLSKLGLEEIAIRIGRKIPVGQLEILYRVTMDHPFWFRTVYKELVKPPEVLIPPPIILPEELLPIPPALAPEEAKRKVLAEMKKKWRTRLPFRTSDFIKKFLLMRGRDGAYPYEVWRSFKNALSGMIASPELVEIFRTARGIPVNGMINGELLKEKIPEVMRAHPLYHVPTYDSFRRYFHLLKFLGLIKKSKREISDKWKGVEIERQYYEINIKQKDSKLWNAPQEFVYPLSALGKKEWNRLMKFVEDVRGWRITDEVDAYLDEIETLLAKYRIPHEDFTIKHAYVIQKSERIEEIAKIRKISKKKLIEEIL